MSDEDRNKKCHQCGSEHDVGELNIRNGIYSVSARLCKEHTDEMIKHFETLTQRANALVS